MRVSEASGLSFSCSGLVIRTRRPPRWTPVCMLSYLYHVRSDCLSLENHLGGRLAWDFYPTRTCNLQDMSPRHDDGVGNAHQGGETLMLRTAEMTCSKSSIMHKWQF